MRRYPSRQEALDIVENDGRELKDLSKRSRNDMQVVLCAVAGCSSALRFASARLRDNARVVCVAIDNSRNGSAIYWASNRLKRDVNVIKKQLVLFPQYFMQLSKELREDIEVCRFLLINNSWMFSQVSSRFTSNREFVLSICKVNSAAFQYLSSAQQDDDELARLAIAGCVSNMLFVSNRLKNDRNLWLELVGAFIKKDETKGIVYLTVDGKERAGSLYAKVALDYVGELVFAELKKLEDVFNIIYRIEEIGEYSKKCERVDVRGYLLLDVVVCLRLCGW